MQEFRKLLREDDGNLAGIAGVDWNRESTRVAVVTVDGSFGFPNAIGVPARMIFVADEQNFCPKVRLETVLCFDDREIITG